MHKVWTAGYIAQMERKINDDGTYDVDLSFCKGCGICHKACALKAIAMVKEPIWGVSL
jgi:Pyruvate/2-oxoacid:ferredoxin oxidoreductase delta subunit